LLIGDGDVDDRQRGAAAEDRWRLLLRRLRCDGYGGEHHRDRSAKASRYETSASRYETH
jgi:hypothetical protein